MPTSTLAKDSAGMWWLRWEPVPNALLYDIVTPGGAYVQAGAKATEAKLGKLAEPFPMPQIKAYVRDTSSGYEKPPNPFPQPVTLAAVAGKASASMPVNITIRGSAPPPVLTVTSSLSDGDTLTDPVAWTAVPSGAVDTVDFYIDGALMWTEHIAPYTFNGDPGGMLDPATLSDGTHIFMVIATAADTTTASDSDTLTVDTVVTPPPSANPEGRVSFWMYATSQTDYLFTGGRPTTADKAFMVDKWDAIEGWLAIQPTFHPRVFRYDDMIQIYVGSSTLTTHPEWVLKRSTGTQVTYNGHYLADIGNPAYQDFKANECAAFITNSNFFGIKADDVNLDRVVSGPDVINPRTGVAYTLAQWQKDNADMMTKVRTKVKAARSDAEIVHNSLYWASGPDVDRCIQQADGFMLERGFNDTNFTPASINTVWTFVAKLHSMGKYAVHLSQYTGTQATTFNLACSLLCSNGRDYIYGEGWKPEAWNPMWDTNLGAATNSRYSTGTNIWRRDFTGGFAIANLTTKTGSITVT